MGVAAEEGPSAPRWAGKGLAAVGAAGAMRKAGRGVSGGERAGSGLGDAGRDDRGRGQRSPAGGGEGGMRPDAYGRPRDQGQMRMEKVEEGGWLGLRAVRDAGRSF